MTKAQSWLPEKLRPMRSPFRRYYDEIAVEHDGRVYASDGRCAVLSPTRLRHVQRRIKASDATIAFGRAPRSRQPLPKRKLLCPAGIGFAVETIGGLYFDGRYMLGIRQVFGHDLTFSIYAPESPNYRDAVGRPVHVLRLYKGARMVAAVARLFTLPEKP